MTKYLQIGFWTFCCLAIFDFAVNLVFSYPPDPKERPNSLELYFDYGRSNESKIRRMLGPTDVSSAPITKAGWLDESLFEGLPTKASNDQDLMIATYGGSFNQNMSKAIREDYDDEIAVREISAPGGPLNWSYAAYQLDRDQHQADAVVLTLISFTAPIHSMGGMFEEQIRPFTKPIYFLESNELKKMDPVIQSLPQLREAILDNPSLWANHIRHLEAYDPYYEPVLFRETALDNSSIFRMIKRWASKKKQDKVMEEFYASGNFKQDSQTIQLTIEIIKEFATTVREDGKVPLVYIANTQGWSSNFYSAVIPALEEESIPYVSSHIVAPTDNPRFFLEDSHFIPEKDAELASLIVQQIRKNVSK